ncbi:MAG: muconate cycloisomerase [Hyphomicrobiales bacterium]|nr:muconate cycloisomerase [Hyphomicrobiales bacterium]
MLSSAIKAINEKIIDMKVWHLVLPVNSRRDHGIGTVANNIEVVIVKLTSESGAVGFGEASPWAPFTGTPEGNLAALDRYFRPLVIGAMIADLSKIMSEATLVVVHNTEAKAALETALFDLAGHILRMPVWALLGEKCRSEIPLSVSLANPDFATDLSLVEKLQDDGVNIVKIKTGFKNHGFDLMRIRTLRKNFPDLDIRIDYNQGLDVREAEKCVSDIDAFAPTFIEQPVVAHDFETMKRLKNATNSPLLADESVFGPEDMRRAINEEICDGVSVKIMKSGGMMRGIEIAEIAANSNIPGYGGDMFETGIAHLAGTHMIAASPNISLGCEFYHAKYYLIEDLLEEPFAIENGMVQVPDGPGLGINVNLDKLQKYAVNCADGGTR